MGFVACLPKSAVEAGSQSRLPSGVSYVIAPLQHPEYGKLKPHRGA